VNTDEELALRLQQGDRTTLTTLVARHYDALLGYLYRMTGGDRSLAEDLAQETFLRALRAIEQYRRDYRFKPWLYAIATNLARNHYNRADTRRTRSVEAEDDDLSLDDTPTAVCRSWMRSARCWRRWRRCPITSAR
jgi:RNA polymerase sigma-70 factor, ECF subfamily